MAKSEQATSGDEFFFANIGRYLDDELDAASLEPFKVMMSDQANQQRAKDFAAMRGRLQLQLQGYYLTEAQLNELQNFVADPTTRATVEAIRIDQVGKGEMLGNIRRRLTITLLVAGVIFGLVYMFTPSRQAKFNPLEYLGYEATAMEDDTSDRLDLPTSDIGEVKSYLSRYPSLGFAPPAIKAVPANWNLQGATVLDYETAKVVVIEFSNSVIKEKAFLFSYAGKIADLPKSELGNYQGLIYQTYASDRVNMVAWQHSEGVVSLMVGRRSAPELASLIKASI